MSRTRQHTPASGQPAFTSLHHAAWLRHLSLLLALCCSWSFAGAGVAIAAAPDHSKTTGKAVPHPFPHAPIFHAPSSAFSAAPAAPHSAPAWKLTQVAPIARPKSSVSPETMLDEVGRLAHVIPAAQPLAWKRELAAHPSAHRAALLHIRLGEWQMAANEQPGTARTHFRQAQALVPKTDRLHGLAAYDAAVALMFGGAYQDATVAFHVLIAPKTAGRGYDRSYAALWERHASACTGYHALRSAAGIPEPPRLDPLCGAAGLAASLRALALPYDKKTVLAACRVTGRGSSSQDLLNAAPKLHVHAAAVTADDQGLKLLPKPLVAYVEHDHFISVIKADNKGVSYLCSDCGMWPGGRVNLTWAQWHILEATLYLTLTRPGSAADRTLTAALAPVSPSLPPTAQNPPLRLSFTGSLSQLRGSLRLHLPILSRLRGHVFQFKGGIKFCSVVVSTDHCGKEKPPMDKPGTGPVKGPGGGQGPSTGPIKALLAGGPGDGDPVNLATGEEEYTPPTDLVVYNPHGPAIQWGRLCGSLRPADGTYESDDFGAGWSHPYNVQVYDPTVTAASVSQVLSGSSATFAATGSEAAGTSLTWDVVLNGTTVATSASANGWAVSFTGSSPYGGSSGSFTITPPSAATLATGYEVRYLNVGYYQTAYASVLFDVVAVCSVPQGGAASIPSSGSDSPAVGTTWDILKSGVTVATSSLSGGWLVSTTGSTSAAPLTIQAPIQALIGGGYEVRFHGYQANQSVFFSVGNARLTAGAGSTNYKYVLLPNGARIQFTAPAVPTTSQPKVTCAVEPGVAMLVEWDYDAASPTGHYTITLPDRTRWITTAPSQEVVSTGNGYPYSYSLLYSLAQVVDRNGNALNFTYGYISPADGWPLLTSIADGSTGTTLLSLNRDTNGGVTSVSDAYGRSVVYHRSNLNTAYWPMLELDQVSQIIPTADLGQSGLPGGYAYGYTIVSGDGVLSARLHTISVPSPAGGGVTSTAMINYDAQGYVSSLVDGNGNTRTYTSDTGYNGNPNLIHVTVSNASVTAYTYSITYDANMSETSEMDGTGQVVYKAVYADPNDPYRPSAEYDGNAAAAFSSGVTGVPQGGSATLAPSTTSYVQDPTWRVLLNGTVIATGEQMNGWSVSYNSGAGTLVVGAPTSATLGSGYQAQYNTSPGSNPGYGPYSSFSVVTGGSAAPATYAWDSHGSLLTETSPRGTTTTYSYSFANFGLGEMIQVQEGNKSPTTYAYFEPSGLVQSVTAPLPGTTNSSQTVQASYTYDSLGNVLTVTAPGNNAASNITSTFNYTADGTYSQPAALGQPLTVTNGLGKITHLRYDAQGNVMAVKDALGDETDRTYDIRNAPLQTVLPATGQTGSGHGGSQAGYLYAEPSGFATAQWPAATLQYGPATTGTQYDEGNVGAIRQTVSAYGAEGELLSVSGSTEPVTYVYDALYRLKTLADAANHITSYFYNAAGYTAQVVYPGAQAAPPTAPLTAGHADTMTFPAYDADGNLLSRVDGNNATTSYTYNDPESRLTAVTYPTGTIGSIGLTYDAYGRRNAMTDGTGSQTYAYDDDNKLTNKTVTWAGLAAKTLTYSFYANGSRSSMTADGRAFAYAYDAAGRMNSLTNDNNETTSWAYQDNGWLNTKTLGNGVVTTFTRDPQGRLRDLVNRTSGGATLSGFAVPATGGYDGAGNRLSVTATVNNAPTAYSGTTSYAYDYSQTANPQLNRSQVTGETSTRGGSYTNAFGYDGGTSTGPGNPTSFKGTANAFNADNQVTNTGYGYDGNGNPTTYKSSALAFDPENRLASYAGTTQTDGYDGNGLRAWKQSSVSKTYLLYDGSQPVCEYGSTGVLTAINTFGADGLVSRRNVSGSATTFYTFDERGSVSQRLDSSGSVLSTDLYDGYGARTGTVGQPDPWGYEAQAGYYTDVETGLLLLTHRFYDPNTGRFVTRDPIGYGGGINLHGYTGNNPVNHIDPSGYLKDGGGDIRNGVVGGVIVVGIVVVIGAPITVPVIIGAIVVGAIMGGMNEYNQGGNAVDIGEGAVLGGGSAGIVACGLRFVRPPPRIKPPETPPPPPGSVWPPPPSDPVTGQPLPPPGP